MNLEDSLLHKIQAINDNDKKMSLICFPHAGGSVTNYSDWISYLPEDISFYIIDLPLRGKKIDKPMYDSIEKLIHDIFRSLKLYDIFSSMPYVFFGHSFGARLAFELISFIQHLQQPKPLHFIASGCRSPNFPPQTNLHNASDDCLIDELYKIGGIPDKLINNRQLLTFFMPAIRADLKILETYQSSQDIITNCDVSIFSGVSDNGIFTEHLLDWQKFFDQQVNYYEFVGNHFFINSQKEQVLNRICSIFNNYKLKTE